MPEVEPLRFPSREGGPNQQDQGDLQAVCPSRRRSCALVNTPSPCVNKAICHIQELKRKVENWCQQSGNLQPHVTHEKQHNRKALRFQPSDSDNESLISTELYIEGIGLKIQESGPSSPLRNETTDVLVEVVYLIERLEADRQDAEEALQTEKRRKRTLEKKVDSISVWKQQEYPFVIQKEHEVCIRDITELKWHLKVRREKLSQVQQKVMNMEILNKHLHEDIEFAKKQGPLVKDKLELARDTMNRLKTHQTEADKTYAETKVHLKAIEVELKKMELEAGIERESMEHVVKGIKNQLANKIEELNQLMAHWEAQAAKVKDAEQAIALKEEQCVSMSQCIPEMEGLESTMSERVLELKIGIEEGFRNMNKTKQQINKLQEYVQQTRRDGEVQVSHLEETLSTKHEALAALQEEHQDYEQEMQDNRKRMFDSKKAVKRMLDDKKRMLQKISENDEQRERAREELMEVMAQHGATKAGLEEQERLAFLEEQSTRKELDHLNKELMSEMKAVALLKSQCAMTTEELQKEQRVSELVNQELQNELQDASSATNNLETEVVELRKIYNDKSQKIKTLTERLGEIQLKHRNTSDSLEKEKTLKHDRLNAVKELHCATIKRYDYALTKISDLTKKSTEYREASDKMDEVAATMPAVIEELQSVFDAVEFKNQSATVIMNNLQSDINNCLQRTQQSIKTHTAHSAARQRKMEDIKEALEIALAENAELAHEYRDLQETLMLVKREAVCVLEEKNRADGSYHYFTQLSLLQKRMHKATVKYFKQRSGYSQAELDRCQALSRDTNQKIKTVQEELSKAIQRISASLLSLTDDSTTTTTTTDVDNDNGTANKQAGPDAVGLKRKMRTVQIAE